MPLIGGSDQPALVSAGARTLAGSVFHVLDVLAQSLQFILGPFEFEHVLDPLEQLNFVDRLTQKVVRAGRNGSFDVTQLVERGDHQNHHTARFRIVLELFADLKTT